MKTVFDIYQSITANGSQTYFAGANTASGFVGDYAAIANEQTLERVYIIKGGSGTGKSTLMRKCAEMAENAGYGVKYYLCGSDPDSLDCVVLDDRIAILDGTAPHIRDMTYPGAASELIDVSHYWNTDILEGERDTIVNICRQKSACYTSAYRYLAAAELLEREKCACTDAIFLRDKAEACIDRLIKKLGKPSQKSGSLHRIRTHALTMKGAVSLTTFRNNAETHYTVTDFFGCAVPFMDLLAEKLTSAGFTITVAKLPVPDVTAGIYIDDCRTSIEVTHQVTDGDQIINMARFANTDFPVGLRGEFRLAAKIQNSCIDEAMTLLGKAAENHFALEKIYIGAMDFDSLDKYTAEIVEKIRLKLLK